MSCTADAEKLKHIQAESLRRFAFCGVTISTVSAILCLFSIPMIYNYMQHIQTQLENEVNFCKSKSGNLWKQIIQVQVKKGALDRLKRTPQNSALLFPSNPYKPPTGARVPNYKPEPIPSQQCPCGYGPPGAMGDNGVDGDNGKDGNAGNDGKPGSDGSVASGNRDSSEDWCFECPDAPAGPEGLPGDKGPTGEPGDNGENGKPGSPGKDGAQGEKGLPGADGRPGMPGPRGNNGVLIQEDGAKGPPGPQGPKGQHGAVGSPGQPGTPGKSGEPGVKGDPGFAGKEGNPGRPGMPGPRGQKGDRGSCNHCAPPRTSPGYR